MSSRLTWMDDFLKANLPKKKNEKIKNTARTDPNNTTTRNQSCQSYDIKRSALFFSYHSHQSKLCPDSRDISVRGPLPYPTPSSPPRFLAGPSGVRSGPELLGHRDLTLLIMQTKCRITDHNVGHVTKSPAYITADQSGRQRGRFTTERRVGGRTAGPAAGCCRLTSYITS